MSRDQHTIQKMIPRIGTSRHGIAVRRMRWQWVGIFALLLVLAWGFVCWHGKRAIDSRGGVTGCTRNTLNSATSIIHDDAWVIGLGTAVFGHTEIGVRIVGNLLMLGASLLMYRFGRAGSVRRPVRWQLCFASLAGVFRCRVYCDDGRGVGFFLDARLVGVTAALRDNRAWGWYLAGFALVRPCSVSILAVPGCGDRIGVCCTSTMAAASANHPPIPIDPVRGGLFSPVSSGMHSTTGPFPFPVPGSLHR
jgi:hypothetical protein